MDFEYIDRLVNDPAAIIYVRTPEGRYRWVNDTFGQALPFTREQVIGKTNEELFGADAAKNWSIADSLVEITGEPITTTEDLFDLRTSKWRKFISTKLRVSLNDEPFIVGISVEVKGPNAAEYLKRLGQLRARILERIQPDA